MDRSGATYQVFAGLLAAYLGLGMVVPVMAPLVRQVGLTEFQGGLIFAVNYLMWVLTSPFWGGRSDRWGRKPVMLIGLLGFSVGHILFGLVADVGLHGWMRGLALLPLLVVTRAFAGALFSATPPSAQAYVVDRVPAHGRTQAVGLLGAAAGLGSVLGPGLTAAVSVFKWPLTVSLYGAALLPVIPTLLLWFFLPPGVERSHDKPRTLLVWDRRIGTVLVLGLIMNTAIALLLFTLGFYFQDRLGLDEHHTTWSSSMAMLIVGVVSVAVQLGLLRVLSWSPITLLRVGLLVMAVGTAQLVWTHSELTIDLAVAVIGAGYALAYPGFQSAITFAVGEDEQGAVAGLAAATGAVAFIIGPVLGTALYQWAWEAPYVLSSALLCVGAAVALMHPRLKSLRRLSKGLPAER